MSDPRYIEGERDTIFEPEEARPPEFTDEALAVEFADRFQHELRYVAAWGKWVRYDGRRWAIDGTLYVLSLARRICREASSKCDKKRIASTIASAKTVAAVERLARADRRLAATTDQWDCDPWLLNTPGGVVDLRTGDMKKHAPELYLTKITAVAPGGECPQFMRFLAQITAGAEDLQSFIARVFGYAATGSTREHSLFFGYGEGANGKSVLLSTAANVLGDYACASPIEVFTASSTDRHPTELARLRGARLVTATETERGRSWAEARIKALTAGDKVAARFMKQDFFEFTPCFKLFVTGNHKPGLQSVDEAMRRRFYLIPFSVTILAADRDPDLAEKLKEEWPGILRWMIEGCLDWQGGGLRPPKIVTEATAEYLSEQDAVGTWIEERCLLGPDFSEKASDLFTSWKSWAERAGETVGKQKTFSAELQKRGFIRTHERSGTIYRGLRLIIDMTADPR